MKFIKPNFSFITLTFFIMTICFINRSFAIPSFARQTNLPCSSCHTIFPELNAFGRLFKLKGYTLTGVETIQVRDSSDNVSLNLLKTLPVSAMLQAAYTYQNKKIPNAENNVISFPQQLSLFLGGQITPRIGGFLQVTYDDQSGSIGIDNTDVRYANQTELASKNLTYGITLNNNPTVQDLWNSTPAWGFPYSNSSVSPFPAAATVLDGSFAQNVLGLGMYAMWNNFIYGEVSLYSSAQQGSPSPPDNSSSSIIKSVAPYWRFTIDKQFTNDEMEIGLFGISSAIYPEGITGTTDKYTDAGFDMNYEKIFNQNMFALRGSWINESRNMDESFKLGNVSLRSSTLKSLKITGNFYLHHQLGFSLGYFSITGDGDPLYYPPAAVTGSANGKPDSKGIIAEFDYLPWLNTKFSLQYIAFNEFNGGSSNYDGNGRNASDNNTLYLGGWLMF